MQGSSLKKLRIENLSISCLRGAFGVKATGTRSSSSLRYATSSSRIGWLAFSSHCLTFSTWNSVALGRDLRSIRSSRNLSDLPSVGMPQPGQCYCDWPHTISLNHWQQLFCYLHSFFLSVLSKSPTITTILYGFLICILQRLFLLHDLIL